MVDERALRELIGRLAGAQRQGFHLTPATVRLVLAALRFTLDARRLLGGSSRDPHDDAPSRRSEPYAGPRPTIADTRHHGVTACFIQCTGPDCWHQRRFTFDALGLDDSTVFVDIPRMRGFRCGRCGGRRVSVSADWTEHVARGNGRPQP